MKKQEIKWVSRDDDGTYVVWKKKPKLNNDGCYDGYGIIQRGASPWERLGINLKCGGLAKVVVKRQY